MNNGFIYLSRSLLESDVFASQKLLKIWIWCLLKSNFKDKHVPLKVGKGETVVGVKRGQFIFGRHKAEEELFIDGSTIYKSIKKLEQMEMITIESNNQYSIITICNYDTYQDLNNYQVTTKEQPSNNQVTSKEQPSNTTNNYNKDNKINKSLLSEVKTSDVPEDLKEYYKIALEFQKLFIKNQQDRDIKPTHQLRATFKNYVNPIRLILEQDEATADDLRDVYKYLDSNSGQFWQSNILSTSTLREKLPKLLMEARKPKPIKENLKINDRL